jgi:hypothetical protein
VYDIFRRFQMDTKKVVILQMNARGYELARRAMRGINEGHITIVNDPKKAEEYVLAEDGPQLFITGPLESNPLDVTLFALRLQKQKPALEVKYFSDTDGLPLDQPDLSCIVWQEYAGLALQRAVLNFLGNP